MTEDCREFRQCRLARMHIQRRRALLTLAAGIGMPAALRLALAQSSAKQGVRTVSRRHENQRQTRRDGDSGSPGDAIVLANGALATFVVGRTRF